ncbi:MAG: chorismate synthase [Promethearchaeota archaeon]
MGDNVLGTRLKITSFGESHGDVIGIVLDGIPAGLEIDMEQVRTQLRYRRPGQSGLTTNRTELDEPVVLSGVFKGKTTGAPLCMIMKNKDVDSSSYEKTKFHLRPSHCDFSAWKRYGGHADYRGSGRFSGRITAGFVMAGAIAKQILRKYNITIFAYTRSIGAVLDDKSYIIDDLSKYLEKREKSPVRALDDEKSKLMVELIEHVKNENDSIGGTIKCMIYNVPAGIGSPVFNNLESNISKAIFSIPAIKGVEFGAGFKASLMRGSQHNDPWIIKDGIIKTSKNDAGGIIGGISTGMPIEFTVAVKPTSTIGLLQNTVDIKTMQEIQVKFAGRHDPCIVPRAVIVVESMAAFALLDQMLMEGKIPLVL